MADTSLNENRLGLLVWQTSNVWQSKLRLILKKYKLSFNEYIILETIYKLSSYDNDISQVIISKNSFVDKSVISSKLNFLQNKDLIKKLSSNDNRSNSISLTLIGSNLIKKLEIEIKIAEEIFFKKLNQETFNFTNSLKLLLGKKIRIKANYNG